MGRPPKNKLPGSAAPPPTKAVMPTSGGKDMPWEEAIQHVLKEERGPLLLSEIAERIVAAGLRRSVGATPASTVAVYLSRSVKNSDSPYFRVDRGVYTLKSSLEEDQDEQVFTETAPDSGEAGALRAFGMYWQRDQLSWTGTPRLMGRQGLGATDVNFAGQIGIYLLHDRDRVIYVGRATDTLFARLKAHTSDRLSGRWDRFSWFGLLSVGSEGELSTTVVPWNQDVVVETLEALLIESLEPPLNRRRGDKLSAAEYLQVVDPQIEAKKRRQLLEDMMRASERS